MVNASVVAFRKSVMEKHPLVVYNKVTSAGQTIPTLSTSTGYAQDDVEKYLGLLIDDALVTRNVGQRMAATYQLS